MLLTFRERAFVVDLFVVDVLITVTVGRKHQ